MMSGMWLAALGSTDIFPFILFLYMNPRAYFSISDCLLQAEHRAWAQEPNVISDSAGSEPRLVTDAFRLSL